jgi:hypothetical protein
VELEIEIDDGISGEFFLKRDNLERTPAPRYVLRSVEILLLFRMEAPLRKREEIRGEKTI